MNRNLWLLALAQGLFLTNNVTLIAINGLVGMHLAPLAWMATLPVMGYVVGSALSTGMVARSQARFGRRVSFQLGLLVALLSAALSAWAVLEQSFWLLVFATVVAGYYNANAQLYRFAAVELCAPSYRDKAVSLVMAGGLMGAVIGPNLALRSKNLLSIDFAGAYVALAGVALLSLLTVSLIRFAPVPRSAAAAGPGRPMAELLRQPVFLVALLSGSLSYGVMNLLMAATPLAMQT
jgi:MFS family permease